MCKKCKTHSLQFKAKAAPAAIQNDETAAQAASRFGIRPAMVSNWKRQMPEGAADIFDKINKTRKQAEAETDEFYGQIGRFKEENGFLPRKLGR